MPVTIEEFAQNDEFVEDAFGSLGRRCRDRDASRQIPNWKPW
jgi:hypothetical protein